MILDSYGVYVVGDINGERYDTKFVQNSLPPAYQLSEHSRITQEEPALPVVW